MNWLDRPTPYSGLGGKTSDIPDYVSVDDVPEPDGSSVSLGVGASGPVTVDLIRSPHILVNAPTNLGKSTLGRSMAVQRLSQGDQCVILDRKMHSHPWARTLAPLVHYADDTASIAATLSRLGWELQRRNQAVRDGRAEDVGPRILVLFEETNATLSRIKALDKSSGAGGALTAFEDLMFMGRAVKVHLVCFAQLASYRSGLTADLLENFDTRVMVGYSETAWRWLAKDCGRYRVAPAGVGRGMVCRRGQAVETQLVHMPEESAAEYVLSSPPAQRMARELSGGRRNLPLAWRSALSR